MAFPEKLLQEDEELVLDLRPHWWYILPSALLLVLAIVIGLVASSIDIGTDWLARTVKIVAVLAILGAMVYFAYRYARWATTNFVVTSKRIIFRQGLVSRRGTQMPLDKVNTVDFSQSVFERVLGAGDLLIESGSDNGVQRFTDVRKPLAVQQEINRQIDLNDRQRWSGRPGDAGAVESIPDQLAKLGELVRQGLVTQAEYEAKKAQLLDRM
ncbi:MAG: PH domain-containing protein [Acidimicrobiia bacterium]|nr:PH domain-containing protein [Acidimicrobiia bacterium]